MRSTKPKLIEKVQQHVVVWGRDEDDEPSGFFLARTEADELTVARDYEDGEQIAWKYDGVAQLPFRATKLALRRLLDSSGSGPLSVQRDCTLEEGPRGSIIYTHDCGERLRLTRATATGLAETLAELKVWDE